MRYTVRYHEVTGDWLVFDIFDTIELVSMHASEADAKLHAKTLEQTWQRKQAYSPTLVPQAA